MINLKTIKDKLRNKPLYVTNEMIQKCDRHIQRAFKNKQDAVNKEPWEPAKYIQVRKRKKTKSKKKPKIKKVGTLLFRTGTMKESISIEKYRNIMKISVGVGYAKYHQYGTKFFPQRRFLPITDDGEVSPALDKDLSKVLKKYIDKEMGIR